MLAALGRAVMLHPEPGADLAFAPTTLRPRPSCGGGAAFKSHLGRRPSGRVSAAVLFGFDAGLRFEDALVLLCGGLVRLGGRSEQFRPLPADKV